MIWYHICNDYTLEKTSGDPKIDFYDVEECEFGFIYYNEFDEPVFLESHYDDLEGEYMEGFE